MSYILDALRRADAERERDPARGIHAHPAVLPEQPRRRLLPWLLAGAVAIAGLGGAFVAVVRPAAAPPAPVVAAPEPVPAPVAPPAQPTAVSAPAAPAVVQVATSVSPPAPPPLVPAERARPEERAVPVERVAPAAQKPASAAPSATGALAVALAASAPAAPAAAAADRVLALAELPADVQRELPKLQISGGVYSDNPAQRMLIVGGQVQSEGAEVAPGVVLEQIRPRTAVLKFRGHRYSVSY